MKRELKNQKVQPIRKGKRQKRDIDVTEFEDLPNEIILKIFHHLGIKDRFRYMAVNKRIRSICIDKKLWEKVHLSDTIPAQLLKLIMDRGCQSISLCQCEIVTDDVTFERNFNLKNLALQDSYETPCEKFNILPKMAASCFNLEKLCVDRFDQFWLMRIPGKIMRCIIQNGATLRVLYLPWSTLDLDCAKWIFTQCTELVELNVRYGTWSQEAIDFMCENLTNKIEKLDLTGQSKFGDRQLETLLTRCNKLTEFGFDQTSVKDHRKIVEVLSGTLIKIMPTKMNLPALLDLAQMPNLEVFCTVYGFIMKMVEKSCPHLIVDSEHLQFASSYPCCKGLWPVKRERQNLDGSEAVLPYGNG